MKYYFIKSGILLLFLIKREVKSEELFIGGAWQYNDDRYRAWLTISLLQLSQLNLTKENLLEKLSFKKKIQAHELNSYFQIS